MSGCCDKDVCNPGAVAKPDAAWRRVLIIALCANASMFVVELAAGLTAGSSALQADALDFLADAANYAISFGIAGLALSVRAWAAMLKSATLLALGVFVVARQHGAPGQEMRFLTSPRWVWSGSWRWSRTPGSR